MTRHYQIVRIMQNEGIGNPNPTQLADKLRRSPLTMTNKKRFRLKAGSEDTIRNWLAPVLDCIIPEIDQENGFLSEAIWKNTRGYIERVCLQLNGCYQYGFLDAAAVMMRRIVETLIIEAYTHLKREAEIKDSDSNYFMLSGLIDQSLGTPGIPIGREAKTALRDIKRVGDRSAHNPRINAVKPDLDNLRSGLRVVVEELIAIAQLRHN